MKHFLCLICLLGVSVVYAATPPQLLQSHWSNKTTGLWTLTLGEQFAVYDNQIWNYDNIEVKGRSTVFTLSNGTQRQTIVVEPKNDHTLILKNGKQKIELSSSQVLFTTVADTGFAPLRTTQNTDKNTTEHTAGSVTDSVVVTGFTDQPTTQISYYIPRLLADNSHGRKTVTSDPTGRFRIAFSTPIPVLFHLGETSVYVNPGDRVTIGVNTAKNQYLFMGDHARLNQELSNNGLPYDVIASVWPAADRSQKTDPATHQAQTEVHARAAKNHLDSLATARHWSAPARHVYNTYLQTRTIDALCALYRTGEPVLADLFQTIDFDDPLLFAVSTSAAQYVMVQKMKAALNERAIAQRGMNEQEADVLRNMRKYKADPAVMQAFMDKYRVRLDGLWEETPEEVYLELFSQAASDLMTSPTNHDRAVANCFFWQWGPTKTPLSAEALAYVEQKLTDPAAKQLLLAKNEEFKATLSATTDLTFNRGTLPAELMNADSIFNAIVAPHQGKVIYIDIWGTWCAPCKREMGFVKQLKKTLADLDVVYIYMANRSAKTPWNANIMEFGLTGKNTIHYNLPAEQQNAFEQKYLSKGFPTYILVDTNGRIVTNKAPRPSDPQAVKRAVEQLF